MRLLIFSMLHRKAGKGNVFHYVDVSSQGKRARRLITLISVIAHLTCRVAFRTFRVTKVNPCLDENDPNYRCNGIRNGRVM